MLDHVLMYFQAQERTKTTLEVLYKNHKNNHNMDEKRKIMSASRYMTIKVVMPTKVTRKRTLGIRV